MDAIAWGVVVVFCLAAAAVAVAMRHQRARAKTVFHFKCPGCRQRIGYQQRQCGHRAACSRCGRPFTFPSEEKAAE